VILCNNSTNVTEHDSGIDDDGTMVVVVVMLVWPNVEVWIIRMLIMFLQLNHYS